MKRLAESLIWVLCLGLAGLGLAQEEELAELVEEVEDIEEADAYIPTGADSNDGTQEQSLGEKFISDGSRINIEKRGFSVVPPKGWEVYQNHPQLSLLMQVPYKKGLKYQRTIQVASFSGSKFIDGTTAKEFEELITRKFSRASSSIEDYRVRHKMDVETEDGRNGLMYYSEFSLEGVALMQAHILVSSQSRHYLLTFTDLAENFEEGKSDKFLGVAWDSMISVQLDTATPSRYRTTAVMVGGIGAVVLVFGLMIFARSRKAGKDYDQLSSGKGLEDVEPETQQEQFIVGSAEAVSDEGLDDDEDFDEDEAV